MKTRKQGTQRKEEKIGWEWKWAEIINEWTGFNASVYVIYPEKVKIGKINFNHLLLSLSSIPPMPQARVYTTSNGWTFCWLCLGEGGPWAPTDRKPKGGQIYKYKQTIFRLGVGGGGAGGGQQEKAERRQLYVWKIGNFFTLCSVASRNFLTLLVSLR
jgi:hypothetical protein